MSNNPITQIKGWVSKGASGGSTWEDTVNYWPCVLSLETDSVKITDKGCPVELKAELEAVKFPVYVQCMYDESASGEDEFEFWMKAPPEDVWVRFHAFASELDTRLLAIFRSVQAEGGKQVFGMETLRTWCALGEDYFAGHQ